jgi:hypothetical protein
VQFDHHKKPCSKCGIAQGSSLNLKSNLLAKRVVLFLNAAFAMAILDLV